MVRLRGFNPISALWPQRPRAEVRAPSAKASAAPVALDAEISQGHSGEDGFGRISHNSLRANGDKMQIFPPFFLSFRDKFSLIFEFVLFCRRNVALLPACDAQVLPGAPERDSGDPRTLPVSSEY